MSWICLLKKTDKPDVTKLTLNFDKSRYYGLGDGKISLSIGVRNYSSPTRKYDFPIFLKGADEAMRILN